jgi:TctA family transporter
VIGFATGILPGIGGAIGDILAYGSTVANNPQEKFGNGNPRGLAGCEGANNAQKAASMIPTVLFGIPGAPFAAVMMAICMYFGIELGTPQLLEDSTFIWALGGAFVASTALAFFIAIFTTRLIVKILEVPFWIYAIIILSIIVWSCMQYTGTLDDLYVLALCSILGLFCKQFRISRPAVMVAFILSAKLENYAQQSLTLYTWTELLSRPLFSILILAALGIFLYSIFKKNRGLDYY